MWRFESEKLKKLKQQQQRKKNKTERERNSFRERENSGDCVREGSKRKRRGRIYREKRKKKMNWDHTVIFTRV